MNRSSKTLAQKIIDAIVEHRLVRAKCMSAANHSILLIWSDSAIATIQGIVDRQLSSPRLQAENQRLRAELKALRPQEDRGVPLLGEVRDGRIEWIGVDTAREQE